MSKQRPSARRTGGRAGPSTDYWRQRIFKNTYTRDARRIEVKKWSVKIQHQGIRRTFSLAAKSRAKAAVEAETIYHIIVTQGWEAAPPLVGRGFPLTDSRGTVESFPKTDVSYWKHRLLRRRDRSPSPPVRGGEFSARIEHAGLSHYFPLATLDEDPAAAKARHIYLALLNEGWDAVNQCFPREVTVAIHWADNPVAWTYATFHTETDDDREPCSPRPASPSALSVAVVEPDATIRRALSFCINAQTGFTCVAAFPSPRDAVREFPRCGAHLALINRSPPDLSSNEWTDNFQRALPDFPVLFFTTYEDSDQLFKATPGGACGYLLKRTALDRLLEPIADSLADGSPLSKAGIARHVRRYFQKVILSLSADDSARDMAKLTLREHEILNLLSKGYVDKEIADALGISVWTVHGHLKKIFEKLGVHTRTEAAIKYLHK